MKTSATILIVEDETVIQSLITTVLLRKNYRILQAHSAVEGIKVSDAFEEIIDLLIVDHSLKTMTGRQVAERLCQSRPDLKVLYISGYPLEQITEQGEAIAGDDFLAKPFSPSDLIGKVAKILNRG